VDREFAEENSPRLRTDVQGGFFGSGPTGSAIRARVRTLARTRKTSANHVLVDLIEAGLQSRESEKEPFLLLVRRLTESSDPTERKRLKEELARMTFSD
jgi:hypothetical protein